MTRTLADMTPEERQECVGMWCDNLVSTAKTPDPVVLACVQGERCWILHTTIHGNWSCFPLDAVAPRMDLPRAWTAEGDPVPLPEPDRGGRWWPTAASIGSVRVTPAGEVALNSGNFRDMNLYLTPDKARDLADILNAAADHTEQEKK